MAVIDFINRYESALTAHDVGALAQCHASRFMQVTRGQAGWRHAWRNNDLGFRAALCRGFAYYQRLGAAEFRAVECRLGQTQSAHALCRVTWLVEQSDASELVRLESTYMLRGRDGAEEIAAFIDHDERERLRERGLLEPSASLLFELPPELLTRPSWPAAVSERLSIDALVRDILVRTG